MAPTSLKIQGQRTRNEIIWRNYKRGHAKVVIGAWNLICRSLAGLAIYLSNKCKHKILNIYDNSNIWERQFREITYEENHYSG